MGDFFVKPPIWAALSLATLIAAGAAAGRLLTRSGAVAAWGVGVIVFGMGGGKFAVPLLVFFLSSSLLSRIGKKRKAAQGETKATRNAWQVLANGGMATAMVLLYALEVKRLPAYETRNFLMLYLAALATVNADTWATEIGGLSRAAPRHLRNWKQVAPGTSGAITAMGTAGAAAGAFVLAVTGRLVWRLNLVEFVAVVWAGFLGSFADSLLGAALQAQYRAPDSERWSDEPATDGRKSERIRGLSWMNNDVVNFLASAAGVLFAWILLYYGSPFR